MAFFGLLFLIGLLPGDAQFDSANRVVERRWKLIGFLTIFRRRLPLSHFCRICWHQSGGVQKGDWITWRVGLERISGRAVYLNYFHVLGDGVCWEAVRFAIELSKLTGLPLSDDIEGVRIK